MADTENTLNEDAIKSFTKSMLVDFLRRRGMPVGGTKAELQERALGAFKLNIPLKAAELRSKDNEGGAALVPFVGPHYVRPSRLTTPLGEQLPDPNTLLEGWSSNCADFPDFEFKDLYNYLCLSTHRSFDHLKLQALKQTKAQNFYTEGHVSKLRYHPISNECSHAFIAAEVLPSFPTQNEKRKPTYKCWVSLSKVTSSVNSAYCNCVAGQGESCNHIAAVLFALKDMTEKKASGEISCTSVACEWIKPRKRKASPIKADSLKKKAAPEKEILAPNPPSAAQVAAFNEQLQKVCPQAAYLLNHAAVTSSALPTLHALDFQFCDRVDLQTKTYFFAQYAESLTCTAAERQKTFALTLGQGKSRYWRAARQGRITSSFFGQIAKRRKDTAPDNVLKQLLGYSPPINTAATAHGNRFEEEAVKAYMARHPSTKVTKSGLIINPEMPYLGASPDALIEDNGQLGVLEVKCPFSLKDVNVEEVGTLKREFFLHRQDGKLCLKRDHNYFFQIQGQMACAQRDFCDFCVWTHKGLFVERVFFDSSLWTETTQKLKSFYVNYFLPELFSSRIRRGKKL